MNHGSQQLNAGIKKESRNWYRYIRPDMEIWLCYASEQ